MRELPVWGYYKQGLRTREHVGSGGAAPRAPEGGAGAQTCLRRPRGSVGHYGHPPRNARICPGCHGVPPPPPRTGSLCSLRGLSVLPGGRGLGLGSRRERLSPPGGKGSAPALGQARPAQGRRPAQAHTHPSFLRKTCGLIRPPVSGFQNHPGTRTPQGGGPGPAPGAATAPAWCSP